MFFMHFQDVALECFEPFEHVGRSDKRIPMVRLLCPPCALYLSRCVFCGEAWGGVTPEVWFVWFIDRRTSRQDLPWPLIIPLSMENGDRHSTPPWLIGLWVIFFSLLLSMHISLCGCVCKVSRWSHPAANACSWFLNQNMDFAMMSAIRMCYTYA